MSVLNGMVAGALGGVVSSLVMTAIRAGEKRAGIIVDTPPEEVHHWLEERSETVRTPDPKEDRALSEVWHLGYGAGLGAVYGALQSELDLEPFPSGPLYGLGVYALSLGAIGPALNMTDAPWDESPPATTPARIVDHLLFGAITAVITEQILERTGSNGWRVA